MKLLFQLMLYCLLFTALVRYSVRGGAVDGLYFYPEAVQKRAIEIGLSDEATIRRKRKQFMIPFILIMAAALIGIIAIWNRVNTFSTAYLQSLLFLEGMNWYDGIVIDRLWVGHSSFWILPGTEDLPFVQTWKQVLKKRIILTVIWIVLSPISAFLVILISGR